MQGNHLSPAEAAKRLGISQKALRLYERHRLVRPIRTIKGWRIYGPVELVRLHQVLTLKAFGLPLASIATLMAGGLGALDSLLALQEAVQRRQADMLKRSVERIKAARRHLAVGETLSVDILATLIVETTMSVKPSYEELEALFHPVTVKHFSAEAQQ